MCVWGGGRERLVLLRVHQSPGVHFSLDSGSSYFRASLGQLGADQKPPAVETLMLWVSSKGGCDTSPAPSAQQLGRYSRRAGGEGHYQALTAAHQMNLKNFTASQHPCSPLTHCDLALPPSPLPTPVILTQVLLFPKRDTSSLKAGQEKCQWIKVSC